MAFLIDTAVADLGKLIVSNYIHKYILVYMWNGGGVKWADFEKCSCGGMKSCLASGCGFRGSVRHLRICSKRFLWMCRTMVNINCWVGSEIHPNDERGEDETGHFVCDGIVFDG